MALILRGVAFEFRSKDDHPAWRKLWDWAIFVGSLLPAILLGVAFANIVKGVPIDANMHYTGGFFNLLNPYALLGGLACLAVFLLHGAIFLTLKTNGAVYERAQAAARKLWLPVVIILLALLVATYFYTDILIHLGVNPGVVPLVGIASILLSGFFLRRGSNGWAFGMTATTITFTLITMFLILFPRVMISSSNLAWSLTIYSAASSLYTLRAMTIVALILVPVVLAYQAWSYWVFRKRVEGKPEHLTY
jgi:cytochrome d ubiquinol oxidase subunit II